MIKIFYSAYTCQGNIGDLLITKYQIEEFAKYGEVYVDSHGMPDYFTSELYNTQNPNIKNFEEEYGMHYRSKNIIKVLRLINCEGFTFYTGSPGPRVPLRKPLRSIVFVRKITLKDARKGYLMLAMYLIWHFYTHNLII